MSSEHAPSVSAAAETPLPDQDAAIQPQTESAAPAAEAEPTQTTSEANEAVAAHETSAAPTAGADYDAKNETVATSIEATAEGGVSGSTVIAPDADTAPASLKKKEPKRKSFGAIPEHKAKKAARRKSTATLRLDCKPGDYYWARLKGFPPWPAMICDEEILPEALLMNRPVTAMRPDGSYRDDFVEGGKNVKDRTYAVMYLFTNEFSWTPNTDLEPLDPQELDITEQGKKSKTLWAAYKVAKEGHDLDYFKAQLVKFDEELRKEREALEAKEAEKQAKKEKKLKRKSDAKAVNDTDVTMDDAPGTEGEKKPKSAKKRKAAEAGADADKPAKTPKAIKLKASKETPEGVSSAKTKAKSKPAKEAEKPLTEAELKQKREKEVLYYRYKLQKGFLSDNAPKDDEMQTMADYFTKLEGFKDLEVSILRVSRIHKVLKAIIKLNSIPKNEEHRFKERSMKLLEIWNKALASDTQGDSAAKEGSDTKVETPANEGSATNGTDAEPKPDTDEKTSEPPAAPVEVSAPGDDAKDEADADKVMVDAKADAPEQATDSIDETEMKTQANDASEIAA